MERTYEGAKEVLDVMMSRKSVRNFSDKPIPDDVLHHLLELGINAASGGNLQPFSIIVVKDQARKDELCRISWGQPFIAKAAVDLVFLVDWSKYQRYAGMTDAPFVANNIFSEFVVAIEDMAMAAQTIEIAANMCGIGACFVASTIDANEEARKLLHNPKYSYPILTMSLGYPASETTARRKHMCFDGMVFEETYPEFTDEDIKRIYEDKFEGLGYKLPSDPERADKKLAQLKAALLTCYSEQRTEEILDSVRAAGRMNEPQRCFGLFYNADNMQKLSKILLDDMREMGIEMK